MQAILSRNRAMNVDDLARLTVCELRKVKNKNFLFFNALAISDLVVFYHSLYFENWAMLFLSFGVFVAGLALYDNYKVSLRFLNEAESGRK